MSDGTAGTATAGTAALGTAAAAVALGTAAAWDSLGQQQLQHLEPPPSDGRVTRAAPVRLAAFRVHGSSPRPSACSFRHHV
jgi:hypothetical protein